MSRKAEPGRRVRDKYGYEGHIISVKGHIAEVRWDDGTSSEHPASQLHRIRGGSRWLLFAVIVLAIGASIALAAFL